MDIDLRTMVLGFITIVVFVTFMLIGIQDSTNKHTIRKQTIEIENLKQEVENYKLKLDSTKNYYNKHIDSLINIKNKTITIYEEIEKDFDDHRIVSDDSVLVYIASQIQD